MATTSTPNAVVIDGTLTDWTAADRIDRGAVSGYTLDARAQGDSFYFAISGPAAIAAGTTVWFDTDRNATTGYKVFGTTPTGVEYGLTINTDSTATLFSLNATTGAQTTVVSSVPFVYSADKTAVEFSVPKTSLGSPSAMNTYWDLNGVPDPVAFTATSGFTVFDTAATQAAAPQRIAIVYSAANAANYFSATAYAQLIMSAESQAMQAGIPFDLITDADLTNLSTLSKYSSIVFPSYQYVDSTQVTAITNTLQQASQQLGIGLIAAGDFMTTDATTKTALAGDPYASEKLLFGASYGGHFSAAGAAALTLKSTDTTGTVLTADPAGKVVHDYVQSIAPSDGKTVIGTVNWTDVALQSGVSGQAIVSETINSGTDQGSTYTAAVATQIGKARNVLFANQAVMADSNLLWQAMDYAGKGTGISVDLEITRNKSIMASRTDMDQAMYVADVSPGAGKQGIYDALIPILQQWKTQYDFVGSYYVDVGDGTNQTGTNWSVSAPYYAQIMALGNELGSHSVTHPEDTNLLTAAQLQTEFQGSETTIDQFMSAYLGKAFSVTGAAVPGNQESVTVDNQILPYYKYITGGYSGVGAGYPGAFGYISPTQTSSVYLAPNMSFDFTLVGFDHMTAAQASAAWQSELTSVAANANTPIYIWPWHDYGATSWNVGGASSAYTTAMYTQLIATAYNAGTEFVTLADLASRIASFQASSITTSVNGNVVTATVTSAHAGDFALDVTGQGTQVIQNVAGYYAYDSGQVFVSETGGSYNITLGTTADAVTHISALPMRADLISVTGNGLNLGFTVIGEGDVTVTMGKRGSGSPVVTGASIVSQSGDTLVLSLGAEGTHTVSLNLPAVSPVVTMALVAADGTPAAGKITPATVLKGTGDVNATVTLSENTTVLGTATADTTGAWQFNTSGLLGAAHTVTASETNASGGIGTASLTFNIQTLGSPVNGTVTPGATSTDIGANLKSGNALQYASGTAIIQLADGQISVGADTTEASVARLYEGLLGRQAETAGESYWNTTLATQSESFVAAGFLNSAEYNARHNALSDTDFVKSLYVDVLGRDGETTGIDSWMLALSGGESRADVVVGVVDSAEAKNHWSSMTSHGVFAYDLNSASVREVYLAALGREAEATGLAAWTQSLDSGMSLGDFGDGVGGSAEFTGLHAGQSNGDYVASLYQNGLGRAPDATGAACWTGALDTGAMTRSQVMLDIATSAEGSAHLNWSL